MQMNIELLDMDLPAFLQLDSMLLENGRIKLLPAQVYLDLPWDTLRGWMHIRGIYGIPTLELIEYVRPLLGNNVVEIGAGRGDFCAHFGIKGTDSKMQDWPSVKRHYRMMKQPTVPYGSHVEELDAVAAVTKYAPEVVFASWVTQLGETGQASMFGVDEEWLLSRVHTYILFGAVSSHGQKRIMARPHSEFTAPWMISRAAPQDRRLYIWNQ